MMDSRTIGIPLEDPEGYKLTVQHAVRITSGGVYVHGAPWSVGSQGYANVSHGCINLSPDNAAWYFDTVGIGDPVIVQRVAAKPAGVQVFRGRRGWDGGRIGIGAQHPIGGA